MSLLKILQSQKAVFALGIFLLATLVSYGGYRYWELGVLRKSLEERVADFEQSLATSERALSMEMQDNANLHEALSSEQTRNNALQTEVSGLAQTVGEISGTVGVLEKLSKTDPELLKKYSRVYFLSENYIPPQLTFVDPQYLYDKEESEEVIFPVLRFLNGMLQAARGDGITLQAVSAYRSFGEQSILKSSYKFTYGAGTANQFSADQGYSEHQLGTTLDFTSPEIQDVFLKFETTKAYKWLTENAHRFGFILSYPKSNSYYQFEPWHWRFVGVTLATKLRNEGKYFYELPQREIDEHLINIFD